MAVNRKLIAAGHKRVCPLLTKYLPDLLSVARHFRQHLLQDPVCDFSVRSCEGRRSGS